MNIFNHFFLSILFLSLSLSVKAQVPEDYYSNSFGKKKEELKTAMKSIIQSHVQRSYADLWTDFQTTDKKDDGKVWDMYSDCIFTFVSNQCGNYQNICDCYNREHSMPKSWFNDGYPMYTDLFHLYPTDGKVNGYRSNYPFGETNGIQYGSGKLGSSTFPGYSGIVFEPADEYKGDFARTYFYMVTCYEDNVTSWTNSEAKQMLNATTYPSFQPWAINLLLKWHRQDPVSEKEINRNNAIYQIQENRNPFIDYPQLAEYIWGDSITYVFDPVENTPNNIENEQLYPVAIYISGNKLHVENLYGGGFIRIYNIYGQLLSQNPANETFSIMLPDEKIFIVNIIDNSGKTAIHKLINSQ